MASQLDDIDRDIREAARRRTMARLVENDLAELVLTDRIDSLLDRRALLKAAEALRT